MSYTLTATDTSIKYMQQQIDDEPITNDGVNYTGDQMTIIGTFTPAEETTIDSFVLGGQLAFAKEAKLSDVRIKTVQLISAGFTHLSMSFPLVLDNRSNILAFKYSVDSRIKYKTVIKMMCCLLQIKLLIAYLRTMG